MANLLCPNCGFSDNPATARFCGQCASQLPTRCAVCGAINPQGFRFCGQCASPLTDTAPLRSLYRVVTVLFADICNSTSFTSVLGPERMYTLLDACLRQLSKAVRRYEGTIDKITGDGLMAVFGMPTTLEQHAVQATYAGLAVLEELERFNAQSRTSDGVTFEVRIGIASGEAVSGGLGSDRSLDVTVIGEAVNLAARLQQFADVNSVLLDEQAARMVAPLFSLSPREPLTIKGFSTPVMTFRVESKRDQPAPVRGVRGQLTPMVGRQNEMALIQAALEPLEQGMGGLIFLTGEAGIGKSRLTAEVLERVKEQGIAVLEGDCFSHTRTVPYNAFMGVVRDFAGILPTDSRESVQVKISRATRQAGVRQEQETISYLEYLLSIDLVDEALLERVRHLDPAQLKQKVFLAIRELILAETRRRPLVLVLDDLQWADELSTQLILFLAQSLDRASFVLYLIARGEYQPHQRLMVGEVMEIADERGIHVQLSPLPPAQLRQMARSLMPEASDGMIEQLTGHAEGVPYYLEELVRDALESDGQPLASIPSSLEALIRARYDRLPEHLQVTLAKAAVIGRRFAVPLLHALQGTSTEENLEQLTQRAFVRPRRANSNEFTFVHILIQETVYKSLLSAQRRNLHEQVGEALERLAGDRLDEQVAVLAFHFSRSDDVAKSITYLLRAADRAAGRYANEEALRLYDLASERMAANPGLYAAERITLDAGRGDVLTLIGQYDQARESYQAAIEAVARAPVPDPVLAGSLERRFATTLEKQNRYDEATTHLRRARTALGSADLEERARINSEEGWIAFHRGNLDEAEQWFREALQEAEEVGVRSLQARIYNRMAGIFYWRGDLATARQMLEDSLAISQQLDDAMAVASILGNLGNVAQGQSDWFSAETYHLKSVDIYARVGNVEGQLKGMVNAASAMIMRGRFGTADELLERTFALATEVNTILLASYARMNQGRASYYEGELARARCHFIESLVLARSIPGQSYSVRATSAEYLARIALLRDKPQLTLNLARKALRWALRSQNSQDIWSARRFLMLVYSRLGLLEETTALLHLLTTEEAEKDPLDRALFLTVRAHHALQLGQVDEAARWEDEAERLFEENQIPSSLRRLG